MRLHGDSENDHKNANGLQSEAFQKRTENDLRVNAKNGKTLLVIANGHVTITSSSTPRAWKMKKVVAVLVSLLAGLISVYQLNCLLLFLNATVYHRISKQVSQSIAFSRQNFISRGKVCKKRRQRRYWVRPGRTRVWWDNFVNEVIVPDEKNFIKDARENFIKDARKTF